MSRGGVALVRALVANALQIVGVGVSLYALFLIWLPLALLGIGGLVLLLGILVEGRS